MASKLKVEELFRMIDSNNSGKITLSEVEHFFLELNTKYGKKYGEDEVRQFFYTLDKNRDGYVDMKEFTDTFMSKYVNNLF